jgi:hypothetical protein
MAVLECFFTFELATSGITATADYNGHLAGFKLKKSTPNSHFNLQLAVIISDQIT